MNKETLRMQMLAGIITESQYKQLLEDMEVVNRILDKISSQGKDSLTPEEKTYLDKYSKGEEDIEEPSPDENAEIHDDLVVKFYPSYYKNEKTYKFFYCEKGLADEFTTVDGKKVKEIIGYSNFVDIPDDKKWILGMPDPYSELEKEIPGLELDPDGCSEADFEEIGYIYSKSGKDIENEYDDEELWDVFYDSLGSSN